MSTINQLNRYGAPRQQVPRQPHEARHPGDVVLDVRGLTISFPTEDGEVRAVSDLSYRARLGRTLAIVGESGSGKSVASLAVLGLHDPRRARISGSIELDGIELVGAPATTFQAMRSTTAAMVFQDPQSSLHPFYRVGKQIAAAYRAHNDVSRAVAHRRAEEILELVGIPNPHRRARQFPHEFSGGMRQRAMIALALVNSPKLLIADEPTTALDVTVQAQILDLLGDLQKELGSAVLLITHDLALVSEFADDVLVMYGGRAVESGRAREVLARPSMPYTQGLLRSIPSPSDDLERLDAIPGAPPNMLNPPSGCPFHPRCAFSGLVRDDACATLLPALRPAPGLARRVTRCHLPDPARTLQASEERR